MNKLRTIPLPTIALRSALCVPLITALYLPLVAALSILMVAALSGCDKLDQIDVTDIAKQTAEKAEKAATQAVDKVTGDTTRSGSIAIHLEQPLNVSRCVGDIARPGQGRPAVLRAASYEDSTSESFPSVYLHAEVPDEGGSKLKGKVIRGQLFVQLEADGPVWHSTTDRQIELLVREIDDIRFTIEVVSGELISTEGGNTTVTGAFHGVLR